MMGMALTEEVPFSTVYLHGLVRDEQGKKMSKSYGNVLDPIEVMDEFGTDALRFTLLTGSSPGNDMNLSIDRIASNRNFANKIWNAARFLVGNLDGAYPTGKPEYTNLSLADRWILSRLHTLIGHVDRLFESHLYSEAGRQIYDFLWNEYADWYIEISKNALYGGTEVDKARTLHILTYVLDQCLRMLHPFIPFVTEEIWQHIPHEGEALIIASWPEYDESFIDKESEEHQGMLMDLVRGVRNIRAEYRVEPSRRIGMLIEAAETAHMGLLDAEYEIFVRLANVDPEQIEITGSLEKQPEKAAIANVGGVTAYLPLAGLVDLDAERARLEKELQEVQVQIIRSENLLKNQGFIGKAPDNVVQRERDKLADLKASSTALQDRLKNL